MGRSEKKNSKKIGWRKKNRGGERLAEWRLLRNTASYVEKRNKNYGELQSGSGDVRLQSGSGDVQLQSGSGDVQLQSGSGDVQLQSGSGDVQLQSGSGDYILSPSEQETTEFGHLDKDEPLEPMDLDNGPTHSPNENESLKGRRVVEIDFFLNEIKRISKHEPFDCGLKDMSFVGETHMGLRSGFRFRCRMCGLSDTVWSEEKSPVKMDVNSSAVTGIMSIGSGYSGLQEMLGIMDVPCMSNATYQRHHKIVADGWHKTALVEMKAAAEEESCLARERGDVDREGCPLLTVVADASWAKRSYGSNYSSMSGVAAIVGYYTRKVLYIGVKNKYCTPCARAESKGVSPKQHICYKNWSQSSSSMEASIIAEGFQLSEEMYGVKYARLIADGDSSVYKHILEHRPYISPTVEKVECKNHLLRNYCRKIRDIATTSTNYVDQHGMNKSTIQVRKRVGASILRLRAAVTKAVEHRKSQNTAHATKVSDLKKDLLNGPSHVFGEHSKCCELKYFCNGSKDNETNIIPSLKECGLYSKIMTAVGYLADNSKSLIEDVTSNVAEHYNSIVAKFVGGKRVNYTQRGSYEARCSAAVVSYNSGTPHNKLHKVLCTASPGKYTKAFEQRRLMKSKYKANKRLEKPRSKRRLLVHPTKEDMYYGNSAQKPDLPDDVFRTKQEEFLKSLTKSHDEIAQCETQTRMQRQSTLWREERRNLLTASNFGVVCKRLPHTSCEKLVTRLLYSEEIDTPGLAYGRNNEAVAIEHLKSSGMNIKECGLFIDPNIPYLAATPDGLIGDDGIIEIKCPSSAEQLTPDEAIVQKKGVVASFWKVEKGKIVGLNKRHNYYFQIQGQLHVTQKQFCDFILWTPKGIKIERVYRDDKFWAENMEKKLISFYKDCILPEIIDPRKTRNMPIRNPKYITDAMKKRNLSTNSKL